MQVPVNIEKARAVLYNKTAENYRRLQVWSNTNVDLRKLIALIKREKKIFAIQDSCVNADPSGSWSDPDPDT